MTKRMASPWIMITKGHNFPRLPCQIRALVLLSIFQMKAVRVLGPLFSSITRTLKLLALMRTENQHNADLHSEAIVQSRYRQAGLEIRHAHYEKVREV